MPEFQPPQINEIIKTNYVDRQIFVPEYQPPVEKEVIVEKIVERPIYVPEYQPPIIKEVINERVVDRPIYIEVEKRVELRATVVGNRVFTAAVDSQALEGAKLDWRKEGMTLLDGWSKYELPKPVERGLLKLTKWFGLNYAAADFVVINVSSPNTANLRAMQRADAARPLVQQTRYQLEWSR